MKKISHKIPFRRTLAIICAATIAMLQCAVLLTVEPVHGAENVKLILTYKSINKTVERSSFKVSGTDGSSHRITVPGEEGAEGAVVELKGKTFKSIFEDAGAKDTNALGTDFIITDAEVVEGTLPSTIDLNNYLFRKCTKGETQLDQLEEIDTIEAETSTNPIKCSSSINKTSVEKGQIVKVSYNWTIDDFLKNSNTYNSIKNELLSINWSVNNGAVFTSNNKTTLTTNKESGNFEVKINGKDNTSTTITGKSNFVTINSVKATTSKARKDISKATISGITDKTYNGKQQKQNIKVTLNGVDLKEGTDYKVSYANRTNVGTCTMTFEGIGEYRGSTRRTFEIKKDPKEDDKKIIDNNKVSIRVKRGKELKKTDKDDDVRKKIEVKANGKTTTDYKLEGYSIGRKESEITVQIDGYDNKITKTIDNTRDSSSGSRSYTGRTGSNFRINRPSNASSSPSTGTTVPNVTYAPDRTITVKEVYLGEKIEDEPQTDPMDGTMTEPMDGTESTDYSDAMDVETPPLQFGPAAGSAAVAAAAAGAGAVGRIRRFKLDTATEAVEQVTNSEE